MSDPRDLIIEPIVSEKSYALLEQNVYTFRVRNDATKPQIHDAIEEIFNVRVASVNTLNRKGKRKTFRGQPGVQSDVKKAVVTLEEGHRIDVTTGL